MKIMIFSLLVAIGKLLSKPRDRKMRIPHPKKALLKQTKVNNVQNKLKEK